MKKTSNIRKTARALAGLPSLSQTEIGKRWKLDTDTVRRLLKEHGVASVPSALKRPHYSLADVWRLEGVSNADLHNSDRHSGLEAPLLTAHDVAKVAGTTPTTIRNYARDKTLESIKLGGSIRFRSSVLELF